MTEPIEIRLCDDNGLVSDEKVEPGSPGTIFDPELTYRKLLNNLRARNSDPDARAPYTDEPFVCTGSAHLAGQVFRCTNPAHMPDAYKFDDPLILTEAESERVAEILVRRGVATYRC
jgi:hypothetical protein